VWNEGRNLDNIVTLDNHREWFAPQWIVAENARNVNTLLGIESIFLLLKNGEFKQFQTLFSHHYDAIKSQAWKYTLLQALQASVNNIFSDISDVASFDSMNQILDIYGNLIMFVSDEKYYNSDNFSSVLSDNTTQWIISLLEDILMSNNAFSPKKNYEILVRIFFDLRKSKRRIPHYNIDSDQIWEIIKQYYNEVFGAYIALEDYDSLSIFVVSSEKFKRYLDIEFIVQQLFARLLEKLKTFTSQKEAHQLKYCIWVLTTYFSSISSKERVFMHVFQRQCDKIYNALPEWEVEYPENVVSLFQEWSKIS